MKKKRYLLIIFIFLLSILLLSCNKIDNTGNNDNEKEKEQEKEIEPEEIIEDKDKEEDTDPEEQIEERERPKRYEIDYDFSYVYYEEGFTYDVTNLILDDNKIMLPDLSGMNRAEIKYIMEKLGVNYDFAFEFTIIKNDSELNKFVKYSYGYEAGDIIDKNKFVYVYTTVLPLTHRVSDKLTLDVPEYYLKSFINDGIGLVTLVRAIDGDTAWFRDCITGEEFKLRFLGINTTESTIKHDAWGKEASKFTSNILRNAKEIVIEREEHKIKDVYDRYLGYVWVDGVLLNLLLVDEAYSGAAAADSKYKEYFTEAMLHAQITGRRYYGEIDPNYDYDIGDYK